MDNLEQFRAQKDEFFRTSSQSPLTTEQKLGFTGLQYFPANPALNLLLELDRIPDEGLVRMQTNTGDVQTYQRYARFSLQIDGQQASLTIFQNEHGFFLPFVDSLAGMETYAAGRYLEPTELPDGRFVVDFNLAYNPYCAYNERWSCPITPPENRLPVPIQAGEKIFEASH
jgi:uncharacterized protein